MSAGKTAGDRNEWRDAVWASGLKPMRRLAALCYADHSGDSTTHVWVATRRGMERTGMGRTAWHEARNGLEAEGWLRETVPATHTEAARYSLTIPAGQCRETDTPIPPDGQGVYRQTDRTPTGTPTEPQQGQPAPEPQQRQETTPMDDATWLAAELDADPAACRAAIDRKRQQAEDRGRPWINVTRMVRSVIPLDEWRQAIAQAPKPRHVPPVSGECDGSDCPGTRHVVESGNSRIVCWGVA